MAEHDTSYKLLFSHHEMVADLVRGFVREDWVAALDFDTLERVREMASATTWASAQTTSSGACAGVSVGSTSICCWSSSPPSTACWRFGC